MATYYIDYVNGSDAYDGASFAAGHPFKTLDGGVGKAAGSIFHIAKSPAPTALCDAQWTNLSKTITLQALTSVAFTDSGTGGIVRATKAAHGYTSGCIVTVSSSTDYDGGWAVTVINSSTFDLDASTYAADRSGTVTPKFTMNVDLCETAWTAITGLITVSGAVTVGGSGYAIGDTFNITTGGTGAIGRVVTVSGTAVATWALNASGNGGYTTGTGKATTKITGGGNNALTVAITTVASAVVTRTAAATDAKEGSYCMKVASPSAVKAYSKLAYWATGTLVLSKYQKLSFWIKNSATITNATEWKVCLCSDVAGATIADTFFIPAIPSTGRWLPLTLTKDGGGNLAASIKSIAIYADATAPATGSNVIVDDFVVCTTNGLNMQSLISKNSLETGGTEGFYGIQSINGNTILLDNDTTTLPAAGQGYSGTTEIVPTYIRKTIKTDMGEASLTAIQSVLASGTSGSNIQYLGGYNTSNDTKDGETFYDGLNGYGYGVNVDTKNYITLSDISVVRYNYGVYLSTSNNNTITTISNANNNTICGVRLASSNNNTITTISNANNNTGYGVYLISSNNNVITDIINANGNTVFGVYLSTSNNNTITTIGNANNNTTSGIALNSNNNNIINTITNANNNGTHGIQATISINNKIGSMSTTGNVASAISNYYGVLYIDTATTAETPTVMDYTDFADGRVFINKLNGNYSAIYTDGGNIVSQASTLTNGSGTEWKFTTETNTNRMSNYPLKLLIAKVACVASKQVTISCWFKKGHNTDIAAELICPAQLGSAEQLQVCPSNTNENQLSINVTPTSAGVLEIYAYAWYVTGHSTVIVDNISITQAS